MRFLFIWCFEQALY